MGLFSVLKNRMRMERQQRYDNSPLIHNSTAEELMWEN